MKDLKIKNNQTIKSAIQKLNDTQEQCLLVINNKNIFLGTLTDGDIRRAILKGKDFKESINNIYNRKPLILSNKFSNHEKNSIYRLMTELRINVVPIIDRKKNIVSYVLSRNSENKNKILKKKNNQTLVVIMAGGEGKRLEPFTKILPKPLIPIKDKPIIEHIIERFSMYNFNKFLNILNYKSKIIKAFIEESKYKKSVIFYEEKFPMGTIGGLTKIYKKLSTNFFVTNCDVIVDIDFNDLTTFHENGKFDLTLIASKKKYEIPYGYCETDDNGKLIKMNEKPSFNFLTNIGVYYMNKKLLKLIPKNKKYDFDEFINLLQKNNHKIGVYPIEDNAWVDIGQWHEYKKTVENW